MADTYSDGIGVRRCSACLRELASCTCEPAPHAFRPLQRLLAAAGADACTLEALAAWTPEQVDEASTWARAQIGATLKDKPGHHTSVRWPDHVAAADHPSPKGLKPMAKTKSGKKAETAASAPPRARARRNDWSSHRVNTHAPGAPPTSTEVAPEPVPVGEAMRRAVEALGEVTIEDDLAASQLRQLAELYENVAKEQAAYDARAEACKVAKKSLESATNMLLEQVRAFTHAKPLPLFDQKKAEADRAAMVAGGDVDEGEAVGQAARRKAPRRAPRC